MPTSRDNHYVPQWYQEGFFEPGSQTLAYLDLNPPGHALPDGRIVPGRSQFNSPTSRCFVERDLYSTFFGTFVNDEIERRLFGAIDTSGAPAVKAFAATDVSEWHRHFQTLFGFVDLQKLRTPKGLDWLRAQYPRLSQNELMEEMQGIRMMNCTIWTEGVREIVSAEDSAIKFIVTDHPVTIYNRAAPPNDPRGAYPHDPSITLKGSQTLFALNRDFCLILTNLEYAKGPVGQPARKTDVRAELPQFDGPHGRIHPKEEALGRRGREGQLDPESSCKTVHRCGAERVAPSRIRHVGELARPRRPIAAAL